MRKHRCGEGFFVQQLHSRAGEGQGSAGSTAPAALGSRRDHPTLARKLQNTKTTSPCPYLGVTGPSLLWFVPQKVCSGLAEPSSLTFLPEPSGEMTQICPPSDSPLRRDTGCCCQRSYTNTPSPGCPQQPRDCH